MLAILKFIFATVGLTFIVTQSKIFKPIRKLGSKIHKDIGYFLECPMCFGFWAGLIVYELHNYNFEIINYCFIGSFFSYLIYLLMRPMMDKYD
jgi:hypothetical protein